MFRPVLKPLMILLCAVALSLSAAIAAPASQQTPVAPLFPFDVRTDPVFQVASYYNAIALRDYARAYNYWEVPPRNETLAQFVAGFATTTDVAAFTHLPVFISAGAGNAYADVPVVVVASHTDGHREVYAGCITAHRVNVPVGNATEPDPNWRLSDSDMRRVAAFNLALLENSCIAASAAESAFDDRSTPSGLLASYYNAITLRDYPRAYNYWETPPQPTLQAFQQGFANTLDVEIILRLDFTVQAAAGSVYASLPTLLIATQTDGSEQLFAGCFVARRSNVPVGNATEPDPNWRLYSADLNRITAIGDSLSLLEGACTP